MTIDLGDLPIGTPPTPAQIQQIKLSINLGNVEDIALSTWTGSPNLVVNTTQVVNFTPSVNSLIVSAGSPNWNSTYTTVQTASASWASGDDVQVSTKVRSSSANWDSTYTTVQTNSSSWLNISDDVFVSTKVRASSANWDSIYTTVQNNSASWLNISDDVFVSTKVRASSASWDSTYTTVQANSVLWLGGGGSDDVLVSTKVRASSASWDSTYTTVLANSASWATDSSDDVLVSTKVRASSANWDSTYTTVQANSASWVNVGTTTIQISGGGTGATTISGARTNLKVPASDNTGITGGIMVSNIVVITQANYDLIVSPLSSILYHII